VKISIGSWKPPETWAEAVKAREERRRECAAEEKRRKRTSWQGYEKIMSLTGQGANPPKPKER
jgi:hypothetical protein